MGWKLFSWQKPDAAVPALRSSNTRRPPPPPPPTPPPPNQWTLKSRRNPRRVAGVRQRRAPKPAAVILAKVGVVAIFPPSPRPRPSCRKPPNLGPGGPGGGGGGGGGGWQKKQKKKKKQKNRVLSPDTPRQPTRPTSLGSRSNPPPLRRSESVCGAVVFGRSFLSSPSKNPPPTPAPGEKTTNGLPVRLAHAGPRDVASDPTSRFPSRLARSTELDL